ncbi:MAG: FMN-binding protein [Deltaproteobacteria bacterium]|nr:FMN-binding protein [Deltaproteobacteria bacterium]
MKKWKKVLLISVGVTALVLGSMRIYLHVIAIKYASGVRIDHAGFSKALSGISDGKYMSSLENPPFMKVKLNVEISGGKIKSINILSHETGKKKSEEIVGRIIKRQSLKVDSVSGATASSKMILKAVEKAVINNYSQNSSRN